MTRLWIYGGYTGSWICLNKPENALIMSQYGWISLNNGEYNWICRHISEKTECWIRQSSRCVWCSIKHNVTEQISEHLLRQRCIQNIVKHLKGVVLQRVQVLNQQFFKVGEKGTLINILWKTQEEGQQRNISEIFVLDTLKTTFWMTDLRDKIKASVSKIRTLFLISKRDGEVSPLLSSCASVSVAEYALIPLIIAT